MLVEQVKTANNNFSSLRSDLDTKFDQFKRELQLDHDQVAELAVKKAKGEKGQPQFRSKGNEDQFVFNDKISDTLESVGSHMKKIEALVKELPSTSAEKVTDSLSKAKGSLKQGQALVATRQKHIKLADRSEFGWKLVKEYQTDDLAADSDDEKHFSKAEKAAEKKVTVAKRKKAAVSKQQRSFSSAPERAWPSAYQGFRPYNGWAARPRATWQSTSNVFKPAMPPVYRPLGPCFSCNEFGHLRNSCPKINQQYPLLGCKVVHGKGFKGSVTWPADYAGGDSSSMYLDNVVLEAGHFQEHRDLPFSGTVKGSLKKKFDFWAHVLKAPRPVLDIISNGYILPLMQLPNQFEGANQKSALTHSVFVDESVADLLDKGCVKVVHRTPHVCSPLLVVVVNSSGKRD